MRKIYSFIKKIISLIYYYGTNHKCPICNYRGRVFISAGLYVKRLNEKCPKCGSLTRNRVLWLYLKEYIDRYCPLTILHFAPEKSIRKNISRDKRFSYKTSEYDESSVSDFHFDLERINLPDNCIDVIICSHVLEHVRNDRMAIKEIFRVLSSKGCALIQIPLWPSESHETYENASITDPRDRIINFGQFDHLRIYGLDFVIRLKDAGFEVEIFDPADFYTLTEMNYFRLSNHLKIRELIFVCKKAIH